VFGIRRVVGRDGEPRLDPVRWPGAVRRGWVIRAGLVAVLLATAATILYAAEPAPEGCAETRASPASSPPGGRSPAQGAVASGGAPTSGSRPAVPAPGAAEPVAGAAVPFEERLPLPAGSVGVTVSLAEPATLAVVRPGDRVDLLTVPTATQSPLTVANAALVLATAGGTPDGAPVAPGAVYLALTPQQARRTVALQARVRFAVVVRG
jgi:hypothetical protein